MCTQGNLALVEKLIQGMKPAELIFSKPDKAFFCERLEDTNHYALEDWVYNYEFAHEKLCTHFQTAHLKGFGVEEYPEAIVAAGAILQYLEQTEHKEIKHIATLSRIEEDKYVWLDRFTIKNLELVQAQFDTGTSLLDVIDDYANAYGWPTNALMVIVTTQKPTKHTGTPQHGGDAL